MLDANEVAGAEVELTGALLVETGADVEGTTTEVVLVVFAFFFVLVVFAFFFVLVEVVVLVTDVDLWLVETEVEVDLGAGTAATALASTRAATTDEAVLVRTAE